MKNQPKQCAPGFTAWDAANVIVNDFKLFPLFVKKGAWRGFHSRIHAMVVMLSPSRTCLSDDETIGTKRFEGFKSEAVLAAEKRGGPLTKSEVVLDHSVPIKCIYRELEELYDRGKLTVRRVAKLLRKMVVCALITKDEDRRLSEEGLKSEMPDGWPDDPFARYSHCGIRIVRANGNRR